MAQPFAPLACLLYTSARNANKVRKQPLRVILNGLGKDAAMIISRINGFTYVKTQFDYKTLSLIHIYPP